MTASKTYDITYPSAIAGIEAADTGADMKTVEQLVADIGGATDIIRTVRPTRMEYGYNPVERV